MEPLPSLFLMQTIDHLNYMTGSSMNEIAWK